MLFCDSIHLMAANQKRKRLNSASILDCNPKERSRLKKKNSVLPQNGLDFKSHIALEWDKNKRNVIAKRQQIGLSWRYLKEFVKSMMDRTILGDVFDIPQEILNLENLKEVLSHEVWQNYLSENERNHLMQFLPGGLENEEVVKALLAGENFHFGNPFLSWSASVCSGKCHPDVVLCQEQSLQVNRNAYCLELQSYHNNMIRHLLKLKESFTNWKDLEKESLEQTWRARNNAEKRVCSQEKECGFDDLDDDVMATSESDSGAADEIASSSDNLISSVKNRRGLSKWMSKKGLVGEKFGNSLISSRDLFDEEGRAVKGDNLQKHDLCSDGTKYMSYFKISKRQHELVKNLKQSGKSIHASSLNQVLGNMGLFHVKPYEVFVEEEQKNLHEHWLQLVKTHLPVAHANRRDIHLLRQKLIHSLEQDLKHKQTKIGDPDEKTENCDSLFHVWKDKPVSKNQSLVEDNEKYCPCPPGNQFLQHVSADHEVNNLDQVSENYENTKLDDTQLEQRGYPGNLKSEDVEASKRAPFPLDGDIWRGGVPHSYFDSSASHEYESTNNLSHVHSLLTEDRKKHSIALESISCSGDYGKSLTAGQLDDSTFGSYQNQDRSELLNSLIKSHGGLSYHGEGKEADLNLRQPNNVMAENGEYSGHFQKHSFSSLPLGQSRDDGIFLQQNVSDNLFVNDGRYLIPRQEHLAPANVQNWDIGSVHMPTPLQNHPNGGTLSASNWFSVQNQVCSGWTSSNMVTVPSQSIGNGSSSDQSLFSVLSQYNNSMGSLHSTGSTEQYILPRSYEILGGGTRVGPVLPQPSHPFDYLGGHEAAATLIPEDMGWMGIPHHNSTLSDPTEKPYLRSWNK